MRNRLRRLLRDERGAALAVIAVSAVALMSMMALAIDMGKMFTARSEAQRIADSAALAGASAFLDFAPADATPVAEDRAVDYGVRNYIRNEAVDTADVAVEVIPAEMKVRVHVKRDAVPTWFARFFGIGSVDISATAAAVAVDAGAAKCLKPLAVPDTWHDVNQDDGDRVFEPGEGWTFDPGTDQYKRYTGPGGDPDENGYGSGWRDGADPGVQGDYGRQIALKVADPNAENAITPSIFYPWQIPEDPNMAPCDMGGGGGTTGAAVYRQNICSCNASTVVLGQEYDFQTGNMVGPTYQGFNELVSEDPGAHWDPNANGGLGGVAGSAYGTGWMQSPRVVKIAMFDPSQLATIQSGNRSNIVFNNFALFFVERQTSPQQPVVGRFLFYASGEAAPGTVTGSLVKFLRLVE